MDFDTNIVRYSYTSLTTPNSVIDYNMDTKEQTVLKEQEVLDSNFSKDNYVSERLYAIARDGVKVPISLVYKKGIQKNASTPLLLYSYGSYGSSTEPRFSSTRLSLLDRGLFLPWLILEEVRKWVDIGMKMENFLKRKIHLLIL